MSREREPVPERGPLYRALVNAEERRLRAGWRILCYALLVGGSLLLAQIPLALLLSLAHLPPWAELTLDSGVYLAGVLLATWLARRLLDKQPLVDLGLRPRPGWWSDLVFGVGLGGFLMAAIYGFESAVAWLEFQQFAWQAASWGQILPPLGAALILYVVVGINEELMIRGYILRNLAEGLSIPWAVIISSLVFGLLHLGNPFTTWVSTLNITLAGMFLAVGVLVTHRLWLPIGLHFGWNFFQGTVFGFPVSGTGGFRLIRQTVAGPEWATGGEFGPEAGVVGLLAMVLGTTLIWLWGRTRHRTPRAE